MPGGRVRQGRLFAQPLRVRVICAIESHVAAPAPPANPAMRDLVPVLGCVLDFPGSTWVRSSPVRSGARYSRTHPLWPVSSSSRSSGQSVQIDGLAGLPLGRNRS